jgi:hypothetical protein
MAGIHGLEHNRFAARFAHDDAIRRMRSDSYQIPDGDCLSPYSRAAGPPARPAGLVQAQSAESSTVTRAPSQGCAWR